MGLLRLPSVADRLEMSGHTGAIAPSKNDPVALLIGTLLIKESTRATA
jgi:hypothetical protein